MTPKKSTTPKRAPKPKPRECWCIHRPGDPLFPESCHISLHDAIAQALERRTAEAEIVNGKVRVVVNEPCQLIRVRISPLPAPARKAAKRGKEGRK